MKEFRLIQMFSSWSQFIWVISFIVLCWNTFLKSSVYGQSLVSINVLFLNEVDNDEATQAVDIARTYINKNPNLGLSVQITSVEGNRTDSKDFLDSICRQYGNMIDENQPPHLIFDTTISGLASETVKSFTSALALPTISASFGQDGDLRQWREIRDTEKTEYLLQVMPPADMIPEVIRAIVQYMNITNTAILYDKTFVMDHKYKALLQNIPARHVITSIAAAGDRQRQIENLRNLDINNFFILGSLESIKIVLESAKVEYFDRNFAWHAITQYNGDLAADCPNATIIFLRPQSNPMFRDRLGTLKTTYNLKKEPEVTSVFYFDLALRAFLAIRDMIGIKAWPTNMNYMTCNDYDGTNTPPRSLDLKTFFNAVNESTSYGKFHLVPASGTQMIPYNGYSYMEFDMDISAVSVRDKTAVNTKPLGKWTTGLNSTLDIIVPQDDMRNLTAAVVHRVYTVVQPPFVIRDETAPRKYKGYCIDLLNEIAAELKFDYEIKEAEDGKFGNMDEKGEWNGVVRKLIDKQADIGLGSMSVMAERETVIDFTVPYYDLVGISIMMLLPSTPSSLFKFLTVLETNVWLCILAAYFFTSFLMWVFDRWSPYSYQNNRDKYKDDDEKREFNIKECLWFCMTSLTPQGGGEAPKNLSGRLVAATWWLFGFIIIASYTANLAAFLTVSRLDTPVESLDDLAKQYKILYAPLNGSSAMTYFQRMSDIEGRFYEIWKDMSLNDSLSPVERSKLAVWDYPVSDKYTKMWQAMQEAGLPNSLEEAVARVRNSTTATGFAFLGDATDIRYLVMTNCDLQMVGEEFSRKPYAIAVQQGSPLKDQFNNAILMLLNKRQLEKLKEDWWKNDEYQKQCEQPEDQSDGISIQNIGGVFIVIFVGIGMACITLVFEYWYYKYRKNPKIIDVQEATMKHGIEQQPKYLQKSSDLGRGVTGGGGGGATLGGGNTGLVDPTTGNTSDKQEKGSFFKNTMLRSRITQPHPASFRPKFQI